MAKREDMGPAVKIGYGFAVNHFWAISSSVGWGNSNYHDDVELVQYLINKCAGKKVVETDGLFGSKTWNAIKNFQKSVNEKFYSNCRTDGRVTAMDGDQVVSGSGKNYTIHLLNRLFYQEKRIYYGDPRIDPDLPSVMCLWVSDYF